MPAGYKGRFSVSFCFGPTECLHPNYASLNLQWVGMWLATINFRQLTERETLGVTQQVIQVKLRELEAYK